MSGPKSGMVSSDLVRGALFCGGFLLGVLVARQKPDADLIARESYQATAAICEPVDDRSRKNSLRSNPSRDPSTRKRAPVCDTSTIMQSRRQVPSIPMI